VLAAIIVPKFLSRPDEAKVTKAKIDIKSLEETLGLFKLDNGFYPSTEQGLSALVSKPEIGRIPTRYPEGGYLKRVPADPWGTPFVYLSPGVHSRDFDLISYGADGQPGGESFDADIKSWEID
jgi:general secretion pathway protein G